MKNFDDIGVLFGLALFLNVFQDKYLNWEYLLWDLNFALLDFDFSLIGLDEFFVDDSHVNVADLLL